MSAITINNFISTSWADMCDEEERIEEEKKEANDGFVEVKRKEKRKAEKVEAVEEEIKEKFCMSVISKTECKYGDKCIHAHSLEQLTLTNCAYGKNCAKVKNGKNVDEANICLYVHPDEQSKDLAKYLNRLNIKTIRQVATVRKSLKPVEVKSDVKPVKSEVKLHKSVESEVKLVKQVESEIKPVELEVKPVELKMYLDLATNVVYVYTHHAQAQEVLKKLIESGKTKIQLNVF